MIRETQERIQKHQKGAASTTGATAKSIKGDCDEKDPGPSSSSVVAKDEALDDEPSNQEQQALAKMEVKMEE